MEVSTVTVAAVKGDRDRVGFGCGRGRGQGSGKVERRLWMWPRWRLGVRERSRLVVVVVLVKQVAGRWYNHMVLVKTVVVDEFSCEAVSGSTVNRSCEGVGGLRWLMVEKHHY